MLHDVERFDGRSSELASIFDRRAADGWEYVGTVPGDGEALLVFRRQEKVKSRVINVWERR